MSFSINAVSSAATTTLFNVNSSPAMDRQFQTALTQPPGSGDAKPQDKGNPADGAKPMVTETPEAFGVGVDGSTSAWANGFLSR